MLLLDCEHRIIEETLKQALAYAEDPNHTNAAGLSPREAQTRLIIDLKEAIRTMHDVRGYSRKTEDGHDAQLP